jgi:cation diffusion facilitator family transporter
MKYRACRKCADSVGAVNVVGNILMILIKGYMGVVGQSRGLIADAVHSCADLLATLVMIIGLKLSDREEDADYPYGYGKIEYIVSIIIYLFLMVIAIFIIYEGIVSIVQGRKVIICWSAAWGAIIAIVINELMFRQSVCAGKQINSPSMVAKAWESRSDVYASIAVLIGIIGAKLGFHFMDPLAAAVVGVIIIKICIEYIKESSLNLLDKAPEEEILVNAKKALSTVETVRGIKNIFARELGQYMEFETELYVSAETSVSQCETVKKDVKQAIADSIDRKTIVKVRLFAFSDS